MSRNRIIALGAASAAAIGIAFVARGFLVPEPAQPEPQTVVQQEEKVDVLVLARDVKAGERLTATKLQWRPWPKSMLINGMITIENQPDALNTIGEKRAKVAMVAGEPLLEGKVAQSGDGGVLASLLPKGKRAIAVKVTVESGVGGFIMPNDRVDVLLTRQLTQSGGQSVSITDTVLENVRVLAIDQQYAAEKSDQAAVPDMSTATLEVTPKQAEVLARVQDMGALSLALRSLAEEGEGNLADAKPRLSPKFASQAGGDVHMFRFGYGKLSPALN